MNRAPLRVRLISLLFVSTLLVGCLLCSTNVFAAVVRVEVTSREPAPASIENGRFGPYEILRGIIHLEVDPDDPANRSIVDLRLAERNDRARVEFSTDFELHKPVDPGRGNRRLIYFVNNRGDKFGPYHFSEHAGRNWLYDEGWSYLWTGWNVDVVDSERRLNIQVPTATDSGKTITGKIYAEICSHADDLVYSMPFVWGGTVAYPVVTLDNASATLTMRRYRWDEPVTLPRDQWSFGRLEDGNLVPDPRSLYIKNGFNPGWLYDLVYVGKDPKPAGLGLAAIRDAVSFFRYEKADTAGSVNPLAGFVEHTYAWGHSQSARLLYHLVYEDFNGDEKKRIVLDGLIANCPGSGKGLFNSRFAQTTRHGSHHEDNWYPIDIFPFTTVEQQDPLTGERGDSLARARASGLLPKMFFLNTTSDYWTRAASLLHTDVTGTKDAGIDPAARIYFVAGRTHVDARVGIIGRALLTALDEWVSRGVEPPDSEIPRISDGTLVGLEAYFAEFPAIPGLRKPPSYYQPYRLDLGPRWRSQGIADNAPPVAGPQYAALVPQVGPDGMEIAGIKLPEVAVPLATYTGWNLRSPSFSNTLRRNRGSILPLPRTVEQREAAGDPREAVAERYPSSADYLLEVVQSLLELKRKRLLLDEDFARLLDQAARQAPLLGELRMVDVVAVEDGAEAAFAYFQKLNAAKIDTLYGTSLHRTAYDNNGKGYALMSDGRVDAALEVFKLNTLIAPDAWNVWDSLAECYYDMGRLDEARKNYEQSLALNPDNENGKVMLERIEEEQKQQQPVPEPG